MVIRSGPWGDRPHLYLSVRANSENEARTAILFSRDLYTWRPNSGKSASFEACDYDNGVYTFRVTYYTNKKEGKYVL